MSELEPEGYVEEIRQYSCSGCMGEFWLRDGIEPKCCPHCEAPTERIETKDFGEYRQ